MRRTLVVVAVTTGLAVLAAACGSSDTTTASAEDQASTESDGTPAAESTASEEAAPTSPPTPSAQPEPTPTVAPMPEPEGATTLPLSEDPCTDPAEHKIGTTPTEYTFELAGVDRPLGVIVGEDALAGDSTLWVLLHGAGEGWQQMPPFVTTGLGEAIGPSSSQIIVSAQAGPMVPSFWTEDETFNIEYLSALFGHLSASFCLDRAQVVLHGVGQGLLAINQAICAVDLPVDAAYYFLGMTRLKVCEPPRAIPIVSIDVYDFHPGVGLHWDGSWNPPGALELEIGGPVGATPDDAAVWADLYNCSEGPTEEVLPDEGDVLERDSTRLAYRECDAPIVAFGLENADSGPGPSPAAVEAVAPYVIAELLGFLGR